MENELCVLSFNNPFVKKSLLHGMTVEISNVRLLACMAKGMHFRQLIITPEEHFILAWPPRTCTLSVMVVTSPCFRKSRQNRIVNRNTQNITTINGWSLNALEITV